jgi:hypothetical protein
VGLRAGLDTEARGKTLSPLPGIHWRPEFEFGEKCFPLVTTSLNEDLLAFVLIKHK